MKRWISTLSLTCLLAAPGCFWVTTKSEGKTLRKDVTKLESRVSTKEDELGGKVDELQKTLDEAAKVLKRNSADLGADVERIDSSQREALGLITAAQADAEDVRQAVDRYKASNDERLAALEARVALLETAKTAPPKQSADDLWTAGKTAFEAGKWSDARDVFKKLALGFPDNDHADDAQYFRGETYFQEKNYDSAIGEYQKVWDKFPTSDLADDALFRAGEAAEALMNCTEARAYFGQIKDQYPKSSLVKKAGEKDKALKAAAKDKKKCTS
jgi:tol-pal system protein YbgF